MRYIILLLVVAILAIADVIAKCARNNCLRAVIASGARPGPSSASADCSSYSKGKPAVATLANFRVQVHKC